VVVTIDPARRLADALGIPGGLTGEPRRVEFGERTVDGELWAMMLDTPAMFERVVRSHAADPEQATRIVENRFYRNIAGALSGTQEFMASEALYELNADPRFDLVVVDTPPSRNALDFLEAPGVLTRFLDHPVFKLLMMPTRTGLKVLSLASQPILRAVGRVVGSDALADTTAFFQAFAGMEAGFRARALAVTTLLHDEQTRFVVVVAPRADTVTEALWFVDQLTLQGFGVAAGVVNRLHPAFGDGSAADATRRAQRAGTADHADQAALWRNLADLRTVAEAERRVLGPLHDALAGSARYEVSLLAVDIHDLEALGHVARCLAEPVAG
jgi:anion-transporting  ArsA/GET3 family ATPase